MMITACCLLLVLTEFAFSALPQLPQMQVDVTRPTPTRQVRVSTAAELQTAIDNAVKGDEILLTPGSTYAKQNGFVFKPRNDGGWVIVRTDVAYPVDRRIDRNQNLAKLSWSTCTIGFCYVLWESEHKGGDYGWRFELLELVLPDTTGYGTLFSTDYAQYPTAPATSRLIFDRLWIHPAKVTDSAVNGLRCECSQFALINSIIEDIHKQNQESHALSLYQTPGLLFCCFVDVRFVDAVFQRPDSGRQQLLVCLVDRHDHRRRRSCSRRPHSVGHHDHAKLLVQTGCLVPVGVDLRQESL